MSINCFANKLLQRSTPSLVVAYFSIIQLKLGGSYRCKCLQ